MKKRLFLATILLSSTFAVAENQLHYNMLEFNESASVVLPNDTMHVELSVQVEHKNRETAAQMTARHLQVVQEKIKQNKNFISELGSRRVYPKYDDKQKITSWQDTVSVYVKSSQFNQLAQLISDVQAHAMPRGTWFSLSPEKRQQGIERASSEVLKNLRQRADSISKQLGFSGYQFVKIDMNNRFEGSSNASSDMLLPMAAMARQHKSAIASPAPDINDSAGEQTIYQNVNVLVQMK